MAATGTTTVTVKLKIELDEGIKRYLIDAGWTPPKEGDCYQVGEMCATHHRHITRCEAEDNQRRVVVGYIPLKRHDAALAALERKHAEGLRKQQERHRGELEDLARKQREALRAKRAEVAEEIAKDLEKPREWRIDIGEPAPWAKIARAHAGKTTSSSPAPTQLDPVCTSCSHLVAMHGRGGCAATVSTGRGSSKWCDCARTHASTEPWSWDTSTAATCPPSCSCHKP